MWAREEAQVRALLNAEPVQVIILGNAHDLKETIRALGGGRCEYIRVTTKWVAAFAQGQR
jgi:hypothetical protein